MTVGELIEQLSWLPPNFEIITRYVGVTQNFDNEILSVKEGIIGGPIKADERMGVIIR